jgi:phosphatidate phosphatase APP1
VELAPRTREFLNTRGFPEGALFMRRYEDDGVGSPLAFKRARIDRLLTDYPARKLVLFGDNGEEDSTLFKQVAAETGRVAAAYVRSTLAADPAKLGSLIAFAQWAEVARHAGKAGMIRWMRAQKAALER